MYILHVAKLLQPSYSVSTTNKNTFVLYSDFLRGFEQYIVCRRKPSACTLLFNFVKVYFNTETLSLALNIPLVYSGLFNKALMDMMVDKINSPCSVSFFF